MKRDYREDIREYAQLLDDMRAEYRKARKEYIRLLRNARADGMSYAEIARLTGVSRQRIEQIIKNG